MTYAKVNAELADVKGALDHLAAREASLPPGAGNLQDLKGRKEVQESLIRSSEAVGGSAMAEAARQALARDIAEVEAERQVKVGIRLDRDRLSARLTELEQWTRVNVEGERLMDVADRSCAGWSTDEMRDLARRLDDRLRGQRG